MLTLIKPKSWSRKFVCGIFARLILTGFLPALLLSPLFPAKAYCHEDYDLHNRVILSASEPDYPPFAIVKKDNVADGFSVDILKAVTQAMDIQVEIAVGPWHEIKKQLMAGRIDVLPLVAFSKERAEYFDFTNPYLQMHGAVFVRQGYRGITELKDLWDKEVVVMRGDTAHEYMVRNNLSDHLILTDTFVEALRALAAGRHDAVVVQRLVGLQLIKQLGITNLVTVTGIDREEERSFKPFETPVKIFGQRFCLAVKKGDTELLRHLNEGLAIIIANGTYDGLYDKWFGPILPQPRSVRELIRYFGPLTGLVLLLLGGLGFWLMKREIDRKTLHLHNEISKRQQTEVALQDTLQSLEMAQQVAQVGSWDWKIRENILNWSSETFRQFGLQPNEFEPNYELFEQFIHPEDREAVNHAVQQALVDDLPYSVEARMLRKDGAEWFMHAQGTVARDEQGDVVRVVGTQRDITVSREAEKWLRLQSEIIANMSEGVYLLRADDGIIVFANEKFERMFGYEAGELLDQHVSIVNAPTDKSPQEVANNIITALRETGSWQGEVQNIRKDGTSFWSLANVSEFDHWQYGRVFISIHSDITERKKVAQALRESEKKHRTILSRSIDGFFINDQQGRFIDFNDAYCRLVGYTSDELKGKAIKDLEASESPEDVAEHIRQVIADGHDRFETRHYHKDGHVIDLELSVNYDISIGELFFAFARDITERKRAEATLLESEERYRLISENTVEAICQVNIDGVISFVNRAGLLMYGYDAGEIKRMRFSALLAARSQAEGENAVNRVLAGEIVQGELYVKHRDGHEFPTSYTLAPFKKDGVIVGFSGISRDITERIREEEEQLRRSLAEKESLLKEIHHRVKNNMQIISSLLFLQGQKSENTEVHAVIEESRNRVRAMALIHEKLYRTENLAQIDFNDYLQTLVAHLGATMARPNCQVEVDVEKGDIALSIDTAIPCGLIINELVTNSLKYACIDNRPGRVMVVLRRLTDNRVSIVVGDNGPGLAEGFEYESTKTLGMGLVRNLAEQLYATLEFRNENGLICELVFSLDQQG